MRLGPNNSIRLVLIADPQPQFLNALNADPHARLIQPLVATSAAEAEKILKEFQIPFSAIFINPVLMASGNDLVSLARKHHPTAPVGFISNNQNSARAASAGRADGFVCNPLSFSDILKFVTAKSQSTGAVAA